MRHWHLQINDFYLTSTGDANGRFCKCTIPGADQIFNSVRANTTNGANGKPFNESPLTDGAGIALEIAIPSVDSDPTFAALKTIMNALEQSNGECTLTVSGVPGSFVARAIVFHNPIPFSFGEFITGTVKNIVLRFQTTEIVSVT